MAPQKQYIQDSHEPRYGTMIVQTIVSFYQIIKLVDNIFSFE